MLLRRVIILVCVIACSAISVFVVLIGVSVGDIYRETRLYNKTMEVVASVFELNLLTSDYLMHGANRAQEQWERKFASMMTIVVDLDVGGSISAADKESLIDNAKVLADRFDELVQGVDQGSAANVELSDMLVERIGVLSQQLVTRGFHLNTRVKARMEGLVLRAILCGIALVVALVLVIFFFTRLMIFDVLRPLNGLRESMRQIVAGRPLATFHLKGKGEVEQLISAFAKMNEELGKQRLLLEKKNKELQESQQQVEDQSDAVLNILEDVEDEKNKATDLATDLQKFKLAVDNASDQVVILDKVGVVLYANDACEKITGFSMAESLGRRVSELWGRDESKNFFDRVFAQEEHRVAFAREEVALVRKNGAKYIGDVYLGPIKDADGNVRFYVDIERDVTAVREIDRAKTEFVSMASHQLRTPLTAIAWQLEMLLGECNAKAYGKEHQSLQSVYDSSRRLIALVNALLNVSRIEIGTLIIEPRPTDIVALADVVAAELENEIKNKKIKFIRHYQRDIGEINLDSKLMHIVLENLLANAVKYTRPGGRIELGVVRKNADLIVSVVDNGYGIPLAQQDKIFTKFFRGDNIKTVDPNGTGLGLYIAKSVLEIAGGRVWFESEEGKGSKFFISLPVSGMRERPGINTLG